MAYVYRHIRLDKNEVFYIGIGSDNIGEYKRANNFYKRNEYWKNIVNKTKYKIEIILDDLTWEEACIKEIEFIKLYGRRDLNEGTLVNMTDGGDGTLGLKRSPSQETKEKMRQAKLGKKFSEEHRKKLGASKKGKCYTKGRKHSEETKAKLKIARNNRKDSKYEWLTEKKQCPHCDIIMGLNNLKRYHLDNCKHKKAESISTPSPLYQTTIFSSVR